MLSSNADQLHPDALGVPRFEGSKYAEKTDAGTLSIVRVLRMEGESRWETAINKLPRGRPRPWVYCPFCGRKGQYALTDRFAYFRHGDGDQDCVVGDLESIRHRRAKEALVAGLRQARATSRPLTWSRRCRRCETQDVFPLLAAGAWDDEREEAPYETQDKLRSYRFDAAPTAGTIALAALEVRERHPLPPEKLDDLEREHLPVLEFLARDVIDDRGQTTWTGEGPLPVAYVWRIGAERSPFRCEQCVKDEVSRSAPAPDPDQVLMDRLVSAVRSRGVEAQAECIRCATVAPFSLLRQKEDRHADVSFDGVIFAGEEPGEEVAFALAESLRATPRGVRLTQALLTDLLEDPAPGPLLLPAHAMWAPERQPDQVPRICRRCRQPSDVAAEVDLMWRALASRQELFKRLRAELERQIGLPPGSLEPVTSPFAKAVEERPQDAWRQEYLRELVKVGVRARVRPLQVLATVLAEPKVSEIWSNVADVIPFPHQILAQAASRAEPVDRLDLVVADRVLRKLGPSAEAHGWRAAAWVGEALFDHGGGGHTAWRRGREALTARVFKRVKTGHTEDVLFPRHTRLWLDDALNHGVVQLVGVGDSESVALSERVDQASQLRRAVQAFAKRKFKTVEPIIGPDITLDPAQIEAVNVALGRGLSIITGGAGTGKTTVMKTVLQSLPEDRWIVAAPTGKAVQRIRQQLGSLPNIVGSYTVAKLTTHPDLLEQGTCLVVDEAGFLGLEPACELFREVKRRQRRIQRIVLVGDPNQLPPIDPGAVLADLLDTRSSSGEPLVPRVRLKTGHRSNDAIKSFAQSIERGAPDCKLVEFVDVPDGGDLVQRAKQIISLDLRENSDWQILASTNSLVDELNKAAQSVLNPEGKRFAGSIREGDRVMCTRNRYTGNHVLNGEIGALRVETGVPAKDQRFWVELRDRTVGPFDRTEVALFKLAYAATIHKSQGSEWDTLVLLADPRNRMSRAMLYTAATRAKQRLLIVGSRAAIDRAANSERPRETLLRHLLEGADVRRSSGSEPG